MELAVSFTNLGPYHLARLRALAAALSARGGRLLALETAAEESRYPWRVARAAEPFAWATLLPGAPLERLPARRCAEAMVEVLDRERPDAVAVSGYVRPECLAALGWAKRRGVPAVLMSESQAIDRPRAWWKEAVKSRRVRRFDAALVGGPAHAEYLVDLGLPADRIATGYNAVDHDAFASAADAAREVPAAHPLGGRPYLLCVSRFVGEKNLPTLVDAFARYREATAGEGAWDLVLAGDGPDADAVARAIAASGQGGAIHRPGFLQLDRLPAWYAFAGAFVLPSRSEPWGLVANEAAASAVPLVISDRCGCARTLVPDPPGTTGWRFDPADPAALADRIAHVAGMEHEARLALGRRARDVAAAWGPSRFASGLLAALDLAALPAPPRRRRPAAAAVAAS
jgi:glycosyltransferase involved in cell wall biosynthesis